MSPFNNQNHVVVNVCRNLKLLYWELRKMKGSGQKRKCVEVRHEMKYIPLFEMLERLLQNKNLLQEVFDTCTCINIIPTFIYMYFYY